MMFQFDIFISLEKSSEFYVEKFRDIAMFQGKSLNLIKRLREIKKARYFSLFLIF